ncbi:sirohydrochlorin chelatase [Ornithobacterium rhinotracheale]|uniref:sirohydrochlorin chelatase n=1 Tax=Ornithobacterium rhinotracheale TaxID=28251 RepID=UPI001FF353DB|nr:CbiX/SirB N-terminal domain-containing protein [Ornithobacterium rhinotracheale]MCK0205659.1 CbiX/SirB N-terminal domain-containing protein [Ornithobacterium rhinotracheale]
MKRIKNYILLCSTLLLTLACSKKQENATTPENDGQKKIAVLLVSHGSHSETWRNALLDLEKNTKQEILKDTPAQAVETAFMEYNEPSIATRLKEFDKEGYTDVLIVPVFLTVSPHSFEDIPTIVGLKESPSSMETLKIENIERYPAKAKVHIAPLLDFSNILEKNVLRRVKALSTQPAEEGVTLVGYGDKDYEAEWSNLFKKIGESIKDSLGITDLNYAWCGHIAGYSSEPTQKAIEEILKQKKRDIVIPVLVAHDENFQVKIIGGAIDKVADNKEKVGYKPDAILPDKNVENWIVDITKQYVDKINKGEN